MKDFVLPQEIIYSGCRQQENGLINGCHKKKYFSAGIKGLDSWVYLYPFGESDFFLIMISSW